MESKSFNEVLIADLCFGPESKARVRLGVHPPPFENTNPRPSAFGVCPAQRAAKSANMLWHTPEQIQNPVSPLPTPWRCRVQSPESRASEFYIHWRWKVCNMHKWAESPRLVEPDGGSRSPKKGVMDPKIMPTIKNTLKAHFAQWAAMKSKESSQTFESKSKYKNSRRIPNYPLKGEFMYYIGYIFN